MSCSSYIKPQLCLLHNQIIFCCMSCSSYIKPQPRYRHVFTIVVVCLVLPTSNHNMYSAPFCERSVVCLVLPTSNHNIFMIMDTLQALYVLFFLHQTTTRAGLWMIELGCMSCSSYIKPQHIVYCCSFSSCCMSCSSYIKPQLSRSIHLTSTVVCLVLPTSNHNC